MPIFYDGCPEDYTDAESYTEKRHQLLLLVATTVERVNVHFTLDLEYYSPTYATCHVVESQSVRISNMLISLFILQQVIVVNTDCTYTESLQKDLVVTHFHVTVIGFPWLGKRNY